MIDMRLCDCGSGLRTVRCCSWDPAGATAPGAARILVPMIEAAATAHAQGDDKEAERLCLDVLEMSPGEVASLKLLALLRTATHPRATEALLRRAVAMDPDDLTATSDLALLLIQRNNLADAEVYARNSVRLAPESARSHNLMGIVLTESNRPQAGEYHYRRALELAGARPSTLVAGLAWNLKNQGKMAEARDLYREAVKDEPDNPHILSAFSKLEEADRNIAAASDLLARCEAIDPQNPTLVLQRAVLHGRNRAFDKAFATLEAIAVDGARPLGPHEILEKGRLLDQMGRYDEAFEAFVEGKRLAASTSGHSYLADHAEGLVRRLRGFFRRSRLSILPKATVAPGAQPIFIVGFPRSGTTLVEQMLSAHAQISAGDELPFVNELAAVMPRLLASPLTYPEALAELWMGDHREGLDDLRDQYLRRARLYGVMEEGVSWFTDKMPLNETHLGLVSLVFPASPIVHVLRHPLDVVLSVFSNQLTHGFYCSYALETAARHYALIFDLVKHYKAELTMNYLAIRYEDIVVDSRASLQKMLDFLGLPFEEKCLHFEENNRYARTASYAQVTEKLYDRSRFRYLRYRKQLEPVISILEPAIRELGYAID